MLKNKSIRSGMCQNFRLSTGKEIEFKAAPFCHFNRSHGRVVGVVFHQECLVFNDEAVVYDKGKGIAERQYYLCGQPYGFDPFSVFHVAKLLLLFCNHDAQLVVDLLADVVEVFLALQQDELVVGVFGVFQLFCHRLAALVDDEVLVAE